MDRGKREALLHQIQKIVADQVLAAPIFQQAFPWGVGARVAEPAAGLIQGYPYVGPAEDLRLK
jgi:ABC-type transport system substrate-binding protein